MAFYGAYSFLDVSVTFFAEGTPPTKWNGQPLITTNVWTSPAGIQGFSAVVTNDPDSGGFAQEGITIAPVDTRNIMTTGADESVIHNLVGARPATVTFNLLRVNPLNEFFSVLYERQCDTQQRNTSGVASWGLNQIRLLDLAQADSMQMYGCAFQNPPTINYAREMGSIPWIFDCAYLKTQLGSSTSRKIGV